MKAFYSLCILLIVSSLTIAEDAASDSNSNSNPNSDRDFLNEEMKLQKELLSSIDPNLRPVKNASQTLPIQFGVSIIKMMEIDEVKGFLKMQAWKKFMWTDIQLAWDPAQYDGIQSIRIPSNRVWKPDIVLFNSASDSNEGELHDTLMLVYSSGSVIWIPPAVITSECSFDMTNFPYDDQVCELKFGSWTYDMGLLLHARCMNDVGDADNNCPVRFELNPDFYGELEAADISEYLSHTEWIVTESRGQKNEKKYPCCTETYPDLTFELHLSRRSNYLGCMYIGPAVLISILLPFVFILPALGSSRHFVSIGSLIVMVEQIENLHELFPHGKIALLARYYMSIFALNFMVAWAAILVTCVANRSRDGSNPPSVLRMVFLDFLGRIFCVPRQTYRNVSDREMLDVSEDGETGKPRRASSGGSEWLSIACVLDRLLCLVTVILIIILACAFIPK